jgi:hypothetical protein
MTNIIRTFIAFVVLFATLVVSPALATTGDITVRITDIGAVEHSIGMCTSGYELRDINNARSTPVAFRNGEATLERRVAGEFVAPMFTCVGRVVGFPTSGVDITMH